MLVSRNPALFEFGRHRHEALRDTRVAESLSAFQEARQRANIAVDKIASLTPRQRDVLQGMRRGLLNKQIAWSLDISEKTVKMHRAQVLSKVGCSTTAGAIAIAVEASFAPALS